MPAARLAPPAVAGLRLVGLLLAAAPLVLRAQSEGVPVPPWERRTAPTFAAGGSALYQTAHGSGDARVNDGAGFDVYGGIAVSAFALNVGYQRADQRLPYANTGRVRYSGVFVEPRLAIAPYGNFTPYLAGRVAFLQSHVPTSSRYAASNTHATAYGGGGGVLIALARSIQLDLGAMYTHVDDRVIAEPLADGSQRFDGGGNGATLRAGLVLGFDRWGR